jgi:hypothetical protein
MASLTDSDFQAGGERKADLAGDLDGASGGASMVGADEDESKGPVFAARTNSGGGSGADAGLLARGLNWLGSRVLAPVRAATGGVGPSPGDGRQAALRFISQFEVMTGRRRDCDPANEAEGMPPFEPLTFSNAVRRANEQSKFLLVYLHSPHHDRSQQFCRCARWCVCVCVWCV